MRINHFGRRFKGLSYRYGREVLRENRRRILRMAVLAVGIFVLIYLILRVTRVEPQLMNSAEIATLAERGTVKIGVRTDMPGMCKDGEGLEIELARMLSERLLPDMGSNALKLVEVTSASVGARLSDGTIDLAICMMQKGAQPSQYAYSASYYTDVCRLVVKKDGNTRPTGTLVGCIQGSADAAVMEAYIANNPGQSLAIKTFAAYDDMLRALQNGRIGAAVLSELNIRKYADDYSFTVTDVRVGAIDYAIACPVDSPAIVNLADILLNELRQNGTLDALYRKYGLTQD